MPQGKRRDWPEADIARLMELWDLVGSVALIAIHMKRTPSSIQTQASRKQLPPRSEERGRHRRRWFPEEDERLDSLLKSMRNADGGIPIVSVSEKMGRSVDAIVNRMLANYGEDSDEMNSLVAPPIPLQTTPKKPSRLAGSLRRGKTGGSIPCLNCESMFFSEGSHNRICKNCLKLYEGYASHMMY